MLKAILTTEQEDLLKRERQWLTDLQVVLAQLGATKDDQTTLNRSIQQLDELFLLVIVGEFNAGKSAFINALLGHNLLKEGVTPTTAEINILRFGDASRVEVKGADLRIFHEPVDILKQINIVDTPGTNAVIRKHQEITEEFVPNSDLVLFITSADRPFTESERAFLAQIKEWGKKVVLVINKVDLFQTEEELEQVIGFVRDNGMLLLGTAPDVFPVSARQALRAKQGQPEQWANSRFEPLERYIHDTLDETSRLRLKFLSPLGVGDRLLTKYAGIIDNRLALLNDDFDTLDNLERQLDLYRQDMERDFKFRLADIENILFDMENRGDDYFDENMRIARIFDLMNKKRFQEGFVREVVADLPQQIEQKVSELIDWLVNSDLKQWHSVMDYLDQRKKEYEDRIVGEVGGSFRYDRDHLIDSVGREARTVVETYDTSEEARKLANSAQMAVAETAAAEMGAIGLGALITALATTAAADVTGILAASVVAALGFFVIPARRQSAKKQMEGRVAALRSQLTGSLTAQFNKELNRSLARINDAVAPYTRFVRAERSKMEETQAELNQAKETQGRLRAEIERLI
ncbi:MAG TPA: dynamin family protein [Anaerolineae bacterium]|nr:dynamin family protein [Anaerolineae bacterium]MCB0177905.1 dynamin family protein [Anaerolineae bacterium]MCB0224151.1 dynamin family protein [Anaerolineae bacterium]MCB9103692.1 dynamin family protein [Anaerolineales bacterium]HRV92320.1 dynamin family protein [Anaerolineae bacterium]